MRTQIREAISRALNSASGYHDISFKTGFMSDMQKGGFTLPCAWLCPLELARKTGRREGEKIYEGRIYMLDHIDGLTQYDKDATWDRQEEAAIMVLESAAEDSKNNIISVDNIKCLPDEYALTGYNTISTSVSFEITVGYCADN